MIESKLIAYLSAAQSVPVSMEAPAVPPDKFIVVEKTGSSETDRMLHATFAVQSCAGTLYEAASINESVKELMRAFVWENGISLVEINGDYNFTDTKTKIRRYQAVYDIYYKE